MTEQVDFHAPSARTLELTDLKVIVLSAVVFLYALIHLLYFVNLHTMEWTTNQEMPFILRGLDPGFNSEDFFTNSVENSPRVGFAFVIHTLIALGMDWETALYTVKSALILVRPLLIFFIVLRLAEGMLTTTGSRKYLSGVVISGALFASFVYWIDGAYMIAGWDMVFANDVLSPMSLAATLLMGALLVLVSQRWRGSLLATGALIAMAGWIHPVMGLVGWAWIAIFLVGLREKPLNALREGALLLPFALVPAVVLQLMFGEPGSDLSARAYRDIYVTWRHPWHFDMAYAVNHMRGLPIVGLAFALALILALEARAWRIVTMLGLMAGLAIGALVTQYITTNLLAISLFVSLGPSRTVNMLCLFLFLGLLMAAMARMSSSAGGVKQNDTTTPARPLGHSGFSILGALLLSLPIAGYSVLKGPPLPEQRAIVAWLKDNTGPSDVVAFMDLRPNRPEQGGYFEDNHLTSVIRVYGERPIFYDKTFPLRRHAAVEFRDRHDTARAMVVEDLSDLKCAAQPFRLDYAIYSQEHPNMPDTTPDFEGGPYKLFRVPPPAEPCQG
ncbi:MAG: hypothetical protein AAFO88_02140 [Pseudomonadota bacterium]